MVDIVQVTSRQGVLTLEPIFKEYTLSLGKEDKNNDLLISIFTKLNNPGTLLLIVVEDNKPVGFLWAQPVSQFGERYLRISELYAKQGMLGTKLFERALEYAWEGGFITVKGLVSAERAEGMKRLFKAKVEAVLISVEVDHD